MDTGSGCPGLALLRNFQGEKCQNQRRPETDVVWAGWWQRGWPEFHWARTSVPVSQPRRTWVREDPVLVVPWRVLGFHAPPWAPPHPTTGPSWKPAPTLAAYPAQIPRGLADCGGGSAQGSVCSLSWRGPAGRGGGHDGQDLPTTGRVLMGRICTQRRDSCPAG